MITLRVGVIGGVIGAGGVGVGGSIGTSMRVRATMRMRSTIMSTGVIAVRSRIVTITMTSRIGTTMRLRSGTGGWNRGSSHRSRT